MSSADKQERIFIEAFRREYVAVDENRKLKHQGTEQIALAAFRAWKASSSSCAAIARILQQRRPMRGLRSDEVVEAVPVWAFEDTPEQAPLPESGRMKADPDAVFALAVNGSLPAEAADRVVREAAAAPSTPQPEAPTPRTDAALEKPTFEAYGRLADLARQLERELAEKDSRLAGIIFSGALDEVKCGDLQRWRNEFKAKLSASSASTPHITDDSIRALAAVLHLTCITKSGGMDFDQAVPKIREWLRLYAAPSSTPAPSASAAHWEEEARRYAQNADFWRETYESARSATEAQEARMGGISGANQQNGSDR